MINYVMKTKLLKSRSALVCGKIQNTMGFKGTVPMARGMNLEKKRNLVLKFRAFISIYVSLALSDLLPRFQEKVVRLYLCNPTRFLSIGL